MKTSVLMLAEDPGAVNFLAPLVSEFYKLKVRVYFFAHGAGAKQCDALNHIYEEVGSRSARCIFDEINPDLLVVGTSEDRNALGLQFIDLASERNVVSFGVIDGPMSAAYRFRGASMKALDHAPDYLLVPDAVSFHAYASLGFPKKKIIVVGHPIWDYVRDRYKELSITLKEEWRQKIYADFMPERKLVVFLVDLSTGLLPEEWRRSPEYTLTGRGESDLRTIIVLEEFLDVVANADDSICVALRLHPKVDLNDFEKFKPEVFDICQGGDAYPYLLAADLVVGMSTVLLTEAALLRRPTLSILPREIEKFWLPSIGLGVTPCVTHREDILPQISKLLQAARVEDEILNKSFPPGSAKRAVGTILGRAECHDV